jgi:hypothetical protein
MPKYVVIAAVLIAVGTPALAAEYYVVHDKTTQECEISRFKPDGQSTWVVIGTGAYATNDEARAAKKAAAWCKKKDANN